MVHYISDLVGRGLREIQADYPDWFVGIRQNGVVMGLEFAHPQGAKYVMRHLYENGVWAIFSTLDPRVLQYKPGILLRPELCEELLDRTEVAIRKARAEVRQGGRRGGAGAGVTRDPGGRRPRGRRACHAPGRCSSVPGGRRGPSRPTTGRAVQRIVEAVGRAAEDKAEHYAEWAVRETGFGVVEHKALKNRLCSRGIVDAYRDHDFVTPRIDAERKIVEIPRPAGVVLALTPSTNPVSTVYFKILLALMTRNAVVLSPHPFAKECCADAARMLGEAAVEAGCAGRRRAGGRRAVDPADRRADDRPAHRRDPGHRRRARGARGLRVGQPGDRRRPGQRAGARRRDGRPAPRRRQAGRSKAFDNSVLCTNESVARRRGGGRRPVRPRDAARTARTCWTPTSATGCATRSSPAAASTRRWSARTRRPSPPRPGSGCRAAPGSCSRRSTWPSPRSRSRTRSSARCSGVVRVPSAHRGIRTAVALLRIGGAGHSAVIHSTDPRDGHGVRRGRPGAAGHRQRGRQHRQRRLRHPPGAVDDDRHRLRRAQLAGGEPRAAGTWSTTPGSPTAPTRPRCCRRTTGSCPWAGAAGPVPPYPVASNLAPGGLTPVPTLPSAAALRGRSASSARSCAGSSSKSSTTIIRG